MKKTLLICGHYPLPENIGSNMRTMNFVRFFLKYGTIDIAFSHVSKGVETGNPPFSNEIFLRRKYFSNKFIGSFTRFVKRLPVPIYRFCGDSEKSLLKLIYSRDYDYILVRYLMNTNILFHLNHKYRMRTIIDFDDLLSGSLYETIVGTGANCYKRMLHSVNRQLLSCYERKCLHFRAALFCSERDRELTVNNTNQNNTFVIPNIYRYDSFQDYIFGDGHSNRNVLLFVGTLNYRPNIEGIKWFVRAVFDDFHSRYPDAKLLIVGRAAHEDIRELVESREHVELHGDVEDIKEYYKECRAVVVPLLVGGGTRIKILEAAFAKRPVLSTPIGAEGLDFEDGKNISLFKNCEEFIAKYDELRDKNKYAALAENAMKHVSANFALSKFNEGMESVLNILTCEIPGNGVSAVPQSINN
ncbi:MAG: glycosyltransferase [Nitrospirota bacterium]